MQSNRENMLERIRAALGKNGTAGAVAPTPLEEFSGRPATHTEVENLVGQFCLEVKELGGHAICVNSDAEVRSYLEKLLPDNKPVTVALSDSAVIGDLRISEWLDSRGFGVLQPYAAPEPSEAGQEPVAETNPDGKPRRAPSEADSMKQYMESLLEAQIGMASASYGIAETGTLVYLSGGEQHRLISLLPPIHLCLLDRQRIVPDMNELFRHTAGNFHANARPPQALTLVTGPSCTADIEQTLTTGIHGPGELHVLIY
jgi:L-lactate utilization protein LutC